MFLNMIGVKATTGIKNKAVFINKLHHIYANINTVAQFAFDEQSQFYLWLHLIHVRYLEEA